MCYVYIHQGDVYSRLIYRLAKLSAPLRDHIVHLRYADFTLYVSLTLT